MMPNYQMPIEGVGNDRTANRARARCPESPARPDAQGRRHHGRHHTRAGAHRRGGRSLRRHGARAHPRRHPRSGRRVPHERPEDDQRDPRGRVHPRHGEVPHRAFRGSAGVAGHRHRLHRRIRGALPRRRHLPYRQNPVQCPVRVRGARFRRSAAPHCRGRHDDPHERRAGHGRRRSGRAPHAHDERRNPPHPEPAHRRAVRGGQTAAGTRQPHEVRARKRQAARRELRRRRRSDPGRRRAHDAARR